MADAVTTVPDFLIWHCVGCGAPAEGKKKPCDCATNVGGRTGPSGRHEHTWWDDPEDPEITRLRARVAELEDIVEALRIGEAALNRALKSEVDLRNEVYTERVATAEARADTATRALAVLDKIAWLAAEEDSWFGNENDIAVQRAAAERHRAALSKTEGKG